MLLLGKVWSCSYIHKTFELESLEENDSRFTTEKVVADDVENYCANPNENMKAKPKIIKVQKKKEERRQKIGQVEHKNKKVAVVKNNSS